MDLRFHNPAEDDDFGFDPPASMTSFPTFVSPTAQHADGNSSSLRKCQDFDPVNTGNRFSQENQLPTWTYANTKSLSPAHEWMYPSIGISSAILRHGQVTPANSDSSTSSKVSKEMGQTSRKEGAHRTESKVKTKVGAFSSSTFSSPSQLGVFQSKKAERVTRKATTHSKKPAENPEDQKRKLSLEKNKIAAAKCRANKLQKQDLLQTQSHELMSNNAVLKKLVSEMTEDLRQLQLMLGSHLESGGCEMPEQIHEALTGQKSRHSSHQMNSCDEDTSELTSILHRGSETLQWWSAQDVLAVDKYFHASPSADTFSSATDHFLPCLDFTEEVEITSPEPDNSYVAASAGTSDRWTPRTDDEKN